MMGQSFFSSSEGAAVSSSGVSGISSVFLTSSSFFSSLEDFSSLEAWTPVVETAHLVSSMRTRSSLVSVTLVSGLALTLLPPLAPLVVMVAVVVASF